MEGAARSATDFLVKLFDSFTPNPRPPVVGIVGLDDVVRYFIEKHPGDPQIVAGALLLRPHPKGQLIYQVFLDEFDNICADPSGRPYGQRLVARELSRELGEKFARGRTDLVIFR
jgi:hypothetical protein